MEKIFILATLMAVLTRLCARPVVVVYLLVVTKKVKVPVNWKITVQKMFEVLFFSKFKKKRNK
jgi:hypothetical protein